MHLRRLALIPLLAMLLVPSTSHAASTQATCLLSGQSAQVGTCIAESMPIAALGILVSLLIVAITYMVGEVLNYEQLKGWYKKELWETTKSVILVAIMFSMLIILSGMATALAGNAAIYSAQPGAPQVSAISSNLQGLYDAADVYLGTALSQTRVAFSALYGLSFGVGILKGMTLAFWLPLIPFPAVVPAPPFVLFPFGAIQFGGEVNPLTSNFLESTSSPQASLINDAIAIIVLPVFIIVQAQKDLLPIIALSGFSVFMPLGILLRAMPFLRKLGGTLVAVGISLSLIYPTLLVAFNLPITNYFATIPPPTIGGSVEAACSGSSIIMEIACPFVNFVSGAFPTDHLVNMVLGTQDSTTAAAEILAFGDGFLAGILVLINNSIFPAINIIVNYTLPTIMQFLLFIADLFIGITLTNAIAKPLGGTLRLNIGKMRLG